MTTYELDSSYPANAVVDSTQAQSPAQFTSQYCLSRLSSPPGPRPFGMYCFEERNTLHSYPTGRLGHDTTCHVIEILSPMLLA